MSATVRPIRPPAVLLPPVVWQKIAAFLEAGNTGQIVLDVKDGRVLAYKLTEAGRIVTDKNLHEEEPDGRHRSTR